MKQTRFNLFKTTAILGGVAAFALLASAQAQQATPPTLQRTAASPLAFGLGASHVVAGFDFNGDGKQDLVTLGDGGGNIGFGEVRVTFGDNTGGFATGGSRSLGNFVATVDFAESALAVGAFYSGSPRPGVAVIVNGALQLFNCTAASASSATLSPQTAPSVAPAILRSVVAADLNSDGLSDLVLTGRVTTGVAPAPVVTRGGVWVVLNSAGGFQVPVELVEPGAEAGKIAVGDLDSDGLMDIAVVNSPERRVLVYTATDAGQFDLPPDIVDAWGNEPADVQPRAVAIGQVIPGGGPELVLWCSARVSTTERTLQFAVYERDAIGYFNQQAVANFGTHASGTIPSGDLALGDLNGDGRLDVVGTNPVDGAITVLSVQGAGTSPIALNLSPLTHFACSAVPSSLSLGNVNGDFFVGTTPRIDVVLRHAGQSGKVVDVMLNAPTPVPPTITSATWPGEGGQLAATGGTAPYVWSISSGTLPPHLALSASGNVTLSGQPRANGSYTFTVRAAGSDGAFSAQVFTVVIADAVAHPVGLVAWWPGESAVNEIIGGRHGALNSGATFGAGKVGRAFAFDGVNDFVEVANHSSLSLAGSGFSIECWVQPTVATGSRTIADKRSADGSTASYLLYLQDGVLRLSSHSAGGTIASANSGTALGAGWSHVAATVSGTTVRLFINGAQVYDAANFPTTRAATDGALAIGATRNQTFTFNSFAGNIDELSLYNRALTAAEIAGIHVAGAGGKLRADAARDFSLAANPNGVWSYREVPAESSLTPYVPAGAALMTTPDAGLVGGKIDGWRTQAGISVNRTDDFVFVSSGGSQYDWLPRGLAWGVGFPGGERAVLRWTAPSVGRYAISANFTGADTLPGSTDVHIRHNAAVKFDGIVSSYRGDGLSSTSTITAAAGDTVDFILGANGSTNYDTSAIAASVVFVGVPLELTQTEFPEDATAFGIPWKLTASGGTGPYSFAVKSGALPAALSLAANGDLSGAATEFGHFTFTVEVTDTTGAKAERTYQIAVALESQPPGDLVAWFPAQLHPHDIVDGNRGTVAGTWSYGAGKNGLGFVFDGAEDAVEIASDEMNQVPLTIEAWIKPELRTDGSASEFFPPNIVSGDLRNFGGHGIGVNVFPDGSHLWIDVQHSMVTQGFRQVTGMNFTAGQWAHVALVLSPGNAKTYVNGALADDFTFPQGPMDAAALYRIGRHNEDTGYGAKRFFKGAIDEVSIYRRALSAAEVLVIYNADDLGKIRDDAPRDFSGTRNDADSPWQYGQMGTGLAPVTDTFTRYAEKGSENALRYWRNTGQPDPNVIKNLSEDSYLHWEGQRLSLHPGPGPGRIFSAVRWTAPVAGTYAVFSEFVRLNSQAGTASAHVRHNGNSLPLTTDSTLIGPGARSQIAGRAFMQAGDTVDFIVGSRDDFGFDATGITPSVALLAPAPTLAPIISISIQTQTPAVTHGLWHFTVTRGIDSASANPSLLLQYSATPEVESTWQPVPTFFSSALLVNNPAGSGLWLTDPNLGFATGSYYFRVLQSATGYATVASAAFGNESLMGGNGEAGPIVIGPVPPPAAATNLTIITAKPPAAGKKWNFQADHPVVGGVRLLVQYSLTPSDPSSWQYLPGDAALVRPDANSKKPTLWSLDVSRLSIPSGNVFFRIESTLLGAPSNYSTPFGAASIAGAKADATGPIVVKNAAALTIDAKALLQVGANQQEIVSDLVHSGEQIAYVLSYRNHGGSPASDIAISVMVPPQLELLSATGTTSPIRKNPRDPNSEIIGVKFDLGTLSPSPNFQQRTVVVRVKDGAKKPGRGVIGLIGDVLVESPDFPDQKLNLPILSIADPLRVGLRVGGSEFAFPKGADIPLLFTAENKSPLTLTNTKASVKIPAGAYVDSFLEDNDTNAERVFDKTGRTSELKFEFGDMPPNTSRLVFITLRTPFDTTRNSIYTGNPSKEDPGYTFTAYDALSKKTLVAIGDGFSVNLTNAIVRPPQIDLSKDVEGATLQGRKTFGITYKANAKAEEKLVRGALVAPEGEATYKLSYRNLGEGTAKACEIFDDMPPGCTLVPNSLLLNGQPVLLGGVVKLFNAKNKPIGPNESIKDARTTSRFTINVGDLGAGEGGVFTYRVIASTYRSGKFTPTAPDKNLAVGPGAMFTESLIGGIAGQPEDLVLRVVKPYEFRLDYKRQPGFARAGNVLRFALKYSNAGHLPAHNAFINLPIPTGTTGHSAFFVQTDTATVRARQNDEVLPPNFTGANTGSQRFELGTLEPGETGEIAFYFTVNSPLNQVLADAGEVRIQPFIDAYQTPRTALRTLLSAAAAPPAPKPAGALTAVGSVPLAIPSAPKLYVGRIVPLSAVKGGNMDVTIFFGNAGDTAATGANVAMQIPFETTFLSATPVRMTQPANPADQTNLADTRTTLTTRTETKGSRIERIIVDLPTLPAHSTGCFTMTLEVAQKFGAAAVEDSSCRIVANKQKEKVAIPFATQVRSAEWYFSIFESVNASIWQLGGWIAQKHKATVQEDFKNLTINSQFYSASGLDLLTVRNGALFAPTGFNRALILGPSRMVAAGGGNMVAAGGLNMVAAGGGNAIGMKNVPGFNGTLNASQLLSSIPQMVAAGGGNLVAAGGGNLVGLDGSTLIGNDGSTLIGLDGATLIGNDGSTLIGNDGSTLVGLDGATLIGLDGSTFATINMDGGKPSFSIVGGASIKAGFTAANMVAAGGGNMVAAGGGNMVAAGGGNMVAAGGGNMVAAGGGNAIQKPTKQ